MYYSQLPDEFDMHVARELLKHIPNSIETAIHVMLASCHVGEFHDDPEEAPLALASRSALTSFANTFLTNQAIAMKQSAACKMTPHVYSIQANNYTAPTRNAVMAALPCLSLPLY